MGAFDTRIDFGDVERDVSEVSSTVTLGRQFGPRFAAQATVGAILDGMLGGGDVSPGALLTLGVSYLALYERDARPFVLAQVTLGASTARAVSDDGAEHRLSAGDLRLGVMAGKTFFGALTAYGVGRLFAGPVFFTLGGEDVTGSDTHKYVVGAGAVWRGFAGYELFAEGAFLGERSVSVGLGRAF